MRRIRRDVRRVLCLLPFEVPFYERHGVAAEYVGHPLVDELDGLAGAPPARSSEALALLPGSRRHEVTSLLPTMARAAATLQLERPGLRVRLIAAPGLEVGTLRELAAGVVGLEVVAADRHRALAACRAAFVASGTATLECALLGVPMAVGYRLHGLTYRLARWLVKVPHVALVNLVAGRRVATELVQDAFSEAALVAEGRALLGDAGELPREGLAEVRRRLGPPGASERAARAVLAVAREGR